MIYMKDIGQRNERKKIMSFVYLGVLSLLFIVLIILPADFFDSGQSICLSVVFFNKQCYGCGMTRAIQHLIHLDFKNAYHFNKLAFIVFPLLVYLISNELYKMYKKTKTDD
jgi:hypothetical protein